MRRVSLVLLWLAALCSLAAGQVASVGKAPKSIYVTAPTQAAVRAAITRAKNSTGPDIIYLPDAGTSGITLTSPLPVIAGGSAISYRGVRPSMTHSASVPDNDFTFVGGTWFKGDGTFPCFQQQNAAGSALDADKGSPDANFSTTGARQFEISNIGIQDFSRGFSIGAQNQCGALYSTIHDVWIRDCDDWAVRMANFQHCDIYRIWSYANIYGFRFYADVAKGTLAPGNSYIHELFDNPGSGLTANQLRKHRGLVFESTSGSNLNEIRADRIQANFFSRSATTTFTSQIGGPYSGFVRVAAGTGANLQVGMPVKFGNTGGNGNVNTTQTYYVKTISTDDVTVANSRTGTAITGNFTSSATLVTYGFGNMEVLGGGTSDTVSNCHFTNIDLEGECQGALSIENAIGNTFVVNELFANPSAEQHIVVRTAQPNYFIVTNSFTSDIDGSSTQNFFLGTRDITNSRQNTAQWMGRNSTSSRFTLGLGSADVSVRGGSFEQREPSGGQFTYPLASLGQRVHGNFGGSGSINAGQSGWIGLTGSGTVTINLPAIDAATVGMCFEITNFRTGIATITVNGTQYYDNQSAHVSITLPAVSGATVAKCVIRAVDDGSGGNYHWSVLTLYGGAAIV